MPKKITHREDRTVRRVASAVAEALESRRLLASISGGVLIAQGTAGNDVISTRRSGIDNVIVTTNGADQTFDMDDFDSVRLSGVGGNDQLRNGSGIENVTLDGGSGNDRIADGNGDNTLIGVGGDDFLFPGSGDDHLSGGSGTDTVNYATHASGLRFSLTSFFTDGPTVSRTGETDTLATFENADEDRILDTEHFIGTAFRDTFHYQASESDSSGDFPLITMEGRGGNDGFSSGGTHGRFVALGGSGDDTFGINGGLGGFAQDTTLVGGDGNDVFNFDDDTGPDVLDGGAGTDFISLVHVGTPKVVDLNSFTSVENARSGAEGVLLIGNAASNHLEISNGGTIRGGDGNDTLLGGGGDSDDDTLLGQGGDDFLDGGANADLLSGGAGRDTVSYALRTNAVAVKQNDETANDGEAEENDLVLADVERVLGGSGNDSFVGNALNNTYVGGEGNDTMSGLDGADALQGQGGDDLLVGGNASDFLDGGSGNDDLYGQGGNDTLLGQGGNDQLFANDGARDTVNGGSGTDSGSVDGLDIVTSVETT